MTRIASTPLTVGDILSVATPAELKALGEFKALKASLSSLLGLALGARSWQSLYALIMDIQAAVTDAGSSNRPGPSKPVSETAKSRLSVLLLSATSVKRPLSDPGVAVSHAVAQLMAAARDPAVQYQASRTHNFHHSSRLEGIDMRKAKPAGSLQAVLNRHRKQSALSDTTRR